MGAAIDFIRERGVAAQGKGKRIVVSPASRLTDDIRRDVKAHRLALPSELAANEGQERRSHWQITLIGKTICTIVGEPMPHIEALEAAHCRWSGANIQ